MNSTIKSCIHLIIGMLCLSTLTLKAQQNNSLYFMNGLPQSNQLNPATQPKCGFFLSLPSVEINAGNSAVGFDDVLIYNPAVDSLFWFLHDQGTRNNFLSKIKNNPNLYGETRLDLFSLGFRINNTYLSFGVGQRVESNNFLPADLIRFAVQGNVDSVGGTLRSYDFSGLGVNATYYNEYSLAVSRQINDKWTVGIRGKLLFGIADVNTNSSDVTLTGNGMDSYQMRSLITVNSSIPYLTVYSGTDGKVDSLKFKDIKHGSEVRSMMLNTKNMGLGLDLGVIYRPLDKLSLSFSMLDLGYIKWKDNLHSFKQDASYDFKGVNLVLQDTVNAAKALLDTLKDHFTYNSNTSSYKTSLSPKFYAGVLYQLTKGIGLGALTRQQVIDSKLNSQYTFSLNLYPANALNFTLSYTIANKTYDNFGMGLAFKLAFLQTYIMSERIPLFWHPVAGEWYAIPKDAKNFNLRFGFNLVLGYRHREKKLSGDKPLVDL